MFRVNSNLRMRLSFHRTLYEQRFSGIRPNPYSRTYTTLRTGSTKPISDRVSPYLDLMRLDKPIGTYLLFIPCSWSLTMATFAHPEILLSQFAKTTAVFAIGSFVMRGAGCTVNDLWDMKLDRKVGFLFVGYEMVNVDRSRGLGQDLWLAEL